MDAPTDPTRGMSERLARVETKIDLLLVKIGRRDTDYETRLRSVEHRVWLLSGLAVAAGGGVGTLLAHITGA